MKRLVHKECGFPVIEITRTEIDKVTGMPVDVPAPIMRTYDRPHGPSDRKVSHYETSGDGYTGTRREVWEHVLTHACTHCGYALSADEVEEVEIGTGGMPTGCQPPFGQAAPVPTENPR